MSEADFKKLELGELRKNLLNNIIRLMLIKKQLCGKKYCLAQTKNDMG